jgi:hypothetical protein
MTRYLLSSASALAILATAPALAQNNTSTATQTGTNGDVTVTLPVLLRAGPPSVPSTCQGPHKPLLWLTQLPRRRQSDRQKQQQCSPGPSSFFQSYDV